MQSQFTEPYKSFRCSDLMEEKGLLGLEIMAIVKIPSFVPPLQVYCLPI